jgi:RNA polymerase sigma factor FliA
MRSAAQAQSACSLKADRAVRQRRESGAVPDAAGLAAGAADARLLQLLPQVRFIARRIHRHLPNHVPVEDLYQAGVLGLLDALRKFDPRRQVRFESYMQFRIRGAILDELRSLDWSPRELRRKARRMDELEQELRARLGREPAQEELASAMRVSLRQLHRLRNELHSLEVGSLQEAAVTSEEGVERDHASLLAGPGELNPLAMYSRQENRERVAQAIEQLPQSEARVLALYYYEELTMKEVGEVLGVGESRVSQIHSSAVERLHALLWKEEEKAAPGSGRMPATAALSH